MLRCCLDSLSHSKTSRDQPDRGAFEIEFHFGRQSAAAGQHPGSGSQPRPPFCYGILEITMSQFENNNLLHNLRVGVRMVREGMRPEVASFALAQEGIDAPSPLLEAAARPGVLESMSARPYTHARADQQIAADKRMRAHLAAMQTPLELEEADVVVRWHDDDDADE